MVAVLGKRARSLEETSPCTTRSKRVSRQIQVHHDATTSVCDVALSDSAGRKNTSKLSSLQLTTPTKTRCSSGRPAKHARSDSRAVVSSIDAHFSITKTPIDGQVGDARSKIAPVTPRHRDNLSKALPTTPQNRVLVPGSVKTPNTVLDRNTDGKPSPYAQARQLFSGGCDATLLIGREEERAQVTTFIATHVETSTGGCLYISGPPGTGKSAFVTAILQQVQAEKQITPATINCMSIRSKAELLKTIASELGLSGGHGKIDIELLKANILCDTAGPMHVLMLDEIDRLVDLDLPLLYLLFEWSMLPQSRLVLVGIANALDLTDRLLPRLKSRNIKPSLLPFMPYDATQINDIITTKLKSLTSDSCDPAFLPFIQPAAVLLCSKKVASQTGDLRKAFDIIRRALSLAESEACSRLVGSPSKSPLAMPLSENVNLSSPPVASPSPTKAGSLLQFSVQTAPRATISHVAKVTSQIFSNGTSTRLGQLSMQQKAVLCALAVYEKKARSSLSHALSSMTSFIPPTPSKSGRAKVDSPTVKQLYDSYAELCKKDKALSALSSVEFKDVISGLETLSLVECVAAKGKSSLGLMTPTRTPSRKGKKADFGQLSLGGIGAGDERRLSSVVGFAELNASLTGPGSDILKDFLDG